MAPPLIALKDARLAFGATTLFSGLSLALATGERACLVGRNGTGKSTLLKVIAGLQDLDGGERFLQPGTRVAYLPRTRSSPSTTASPTMWHAIRKAERQIGRAQG